MGRSLGAARGLAWAAVLSSGCGGPESHPPDELPPHGNPVEVSAEWLGALDTETEIAAEHIGYAVRKPDDLKWMQRHLHHVRHALDPSTEPDGPGLGIGVREAALNLHASVGPRIRKPSIQRSSEPVVDDTPEHRQMIEQIRATSTNIVGWTNDALILVDNGLAEPEDIALVAAWVSTISELIDAVGSGTDANGDGTITATIREGGIAQARGALRVSSSPQKSR